MTEYFLRYQPEPEMLNRAMMAWAKPHRSRGEKAKRAALGIVLYLVLVLCVVLLLQNDVVTRSSLLWGGVGIFFGIALWAVVHQQNVKKLTRFTHEAIARHGVINAELSVEDIKLTSKISTTRMNWLCFDEILPLVDATVLRMGAMVYAIPDAALPAGVTPMQFRSDLQRWLEASR